MVGRISANDTNNLRKNNKVFKKISIFAACKVADLAQLVERQLPKLQVAGSRPVIRSKIFLKINVGCIEKSSTFALAKIRRLEA